MAITKIIGAIHAPKSGGKHDSMAKAINYVLNPKKTDGGRLTGSINCLKHTALNDMIETKQLYGKDTGDKRDRQAYHYTISWSPEEKITAEEALELLREFADEYLGNEYEAVYSVHNDHDHIHGHLLFNSVSLRDGKKFRYEDGDWAKIIQPLVDKVCASHGYHTLADDTGMTLEEHDEERKKKKSRSTQRKRRENTEHTSNSNNRYHKDDDEKYSWNDHIRADIDYAILNASQFDEFEYLLEDMGYQIKYGTSEKYGKTMKVKAPGMDIYRRTYALGSEYTVKSIEERIAIKNKPLPIIELPVNVRIIVPVRYFTAYKKMPLNPALRRYYRHLYRLGVKPNYPKRNYHVSREAVERAELEEQRLLMRLNNGIHNHADALSFEEQKKAELEQLLAERKALYERHKPYKKMLTAYKKAMKLMAAYDEYQLGDESKKEDALEYEKQVKIYQKYGFNEEEIPLYKKSMAMELKEMKERIRKKEIAIEAANEMAREYVEEPDDAFTPEEEQFYNSIPVPDALEPDATRKIRS